MLLLENISDKECVVMYSRKQGLSAEGRTFSILTKDSCLRKALTSVYPLGRKWCLVLSRDKKRKPGIFVSLVARTLSKGNCERIGSVSEVLCAPEGQAIDAFELLVI